MTTHSLNVTVSSIAVNAIATAIPALGFVCLVARSMTTMAVGSAVRKAAPMNDAERIDMRKAGQKIFVSTMLNIIAMAFWCSVFAGGIMLLPSQYQGFWILNPVAAWTLTLARTVIYSWQAWKIAKQMHGQ